MMKRIIAILIAFMLCVTLIACSNQPTTQPSTKFSESVMSELTDATSSNNEKDTDDGSSTVHSEKPTDNSTPSTSATTESDTAEKENSETKPSETSEKDSVSTNKTEETAPPKVTESTKPVEETKTETIAPPKEDAPKETETTTEPTETEPVSPPSTYEIEQLVAQYINQYRTSQGSSSTTILTGLAEVARYRARQLVTDFSHNSNPNPCTVLQYGEFIDMTLFGGDASESYYRGYNREAIGKGDWFGTADQMAQRIAKGFKNSSKHWAYVGDSEYNYMAVGVIYNESDGKWYCCICMSSKNYGD